MAKRVVLDADRKREIVAIVGVGCTRRLAAEYVGSSVDAIRRAARRDAEFGEQLRQAEQKCEFVHLNNVQTAGKSNWRASAWLLERRYPERYGPRKPGLVTPEQLRRVLEQLAGVVCEEVESAEVRERILARAGSLADELLRSASK